VPGRGEQTTVPFVLLAILLVLVIVALLLAVYFVVRRWL
jgi:Mg2+ and Co2+ transporter CorA